ncbi:alpha/beta fold hydrolase [Paractinoplanes hotanensis]|uniref:Alpha/beta hydrolase n=1 Tax=Paractinoplanes hotanensis TaxID=2906497 RepID=A0ABT0YAE6_9ACTN|nr:alpha/beta hydrolase [Actinoplanes hotanensis]MCM4083007.1 alpha/beta hydrolase [Actinoplanes hotanensis]
MTEFLTVDGGAIAYEVSGAGPLVVLAHGMGDSRESYRFVVPQLVAAGYRVANVDLRGCGESSAVWPSYSRTDIAGDLIAVVRHLGGPAVLVGQSISGGAVTVAAAQAPDLVEGIVEIVPFTRKLSFKLSDLGSKTYRTGMTRLMMMAVLGSVNWWHKYLDLAFPGRKPADWDEQLRRNADSLAQPGRMKALQKMGQTPATDAGAQLANVRCPVLVIEGSLDPDWVDPRAEGEAILAELPAGLGRLAVVEGAGHYPHTQFPDETVALLLPFLKAHARA